MVPPLSFATLMTILSSGVAKHMQVSLKDTTFLSYDAAAPLSSVSSYSWGSSSFIRPVTVERGSGTMGYGLFVSIVCCFIAWVLHSKSGSERWFGSSPISGSG